MRHTPTGLVLLSSILLAGCHSEGVNGRRIDPGSASASTTGHGILDRLRPKADPNIMEQNRREDAARAAAQLAEQQKLMEQQNQADGTGRVLPKVSTEPFAPPAEEIAKGGPVFSSAPAENSPTMIANATAPLTPMQPQVQTYGGYGGGAGVPPPPPGALGGMIPPPPVVSLSTAVGMGDSPYSNPYMNPYGIPFQPQQQQAPLQAMQPMMAAPQARPSGSPFGGGGYKTTSEDDDDSSTAEKPEKKPVKEFVPITPTGMESRSAFKQRDELKVLWKGALASPALSGIMSDRGFADQVAKIDVGLPSEASKGSLGVNQRSVDNLFRGPALDRRIYGSVKKVQADVAQAYYRYLYSYNKFALAEQTLAAGKQEQEVANTSAEKQRAASSVAHAQSEVESAREDMQSAQSDLASVVGPGAARSVIGRVSGVAPSLESLAVAQSSQTGGGQRGSFMQSMVSPMTNLFHFGGGRHDEPQAAEQEAPKVAKADNKAPTKREKDKKKESKSREKKDSKDRTGDLSPAPTASADDSDGSSSETASAPATSSGGKEQGIAFELKGVNVQPRKSILTVTIRNSGANSYSFSPDVFNVSEGNRKLPEASVRTDFDQTMVQPNSEVKGTITIFGRPWNDKLAVVLADGSRTIQLRR